jgi:hypothetical protein
MKSNIYWRIDVLCFSKKTHCSACKIQLPWWKLEWLFNNLSILYLICTKLEIMFLWTVLQCGTVGNDYSTSIACSKKIITGRLVNLTNWVAMGSACARVCFYGSISWLFKLLLACRVWCAEIYIPFCLVDTLNIFTRKIHFYP